jgi:excisionase family DNA binding protein
MIALDGMASINRLADLVSTWLEKALEEKQQKPRMLSPEEAAKILRIHVQTVTAWCREGKIRAVKNGGNDANGKGGKWLIPREEIDAYLHRQQVIHGKTKGGAK